MQAMGDSIPVTLQSLHRLLSMQSDDVISYVVCPNCDSVYEYQSCFELSRVVQKNQKFVVTFLIQISYMKHVESLVDLCF